MAFTIQYTDNKTSARTGILTTAHGTIETPIFMPVGTAGAVKAVHHKNLKDDIHAQIILGNTYHLYLRPGISVLTKAGGLHRFSGWDKPILTDSGGYQVYSLAHRRKLNPEGVVFQSHIDGSRHHFTPEYVIDIQRAIGADIMMAFDECTPFPCDREYAEKSLEITHQWLGRCMQRYNETQCSYGYHQELFPIVQGSVYRDLRKFSAETIASYPSGGYAIGGLSVGEPAEVMYEMTELVCGILPREKPRYLMGVGTPVNILENIALGIDMFDCVMPTRNGRNGMIFTAQGIINIRNEKWKNDFSLLDEEDTCFVDRQYSKAYLRHLFISNEMNGPMIVSMHNLAFYLWLMKQARLHIAEGTFASWKTVMIKQLSTRL
ncbi:MAG: tRNA guanosine(34) transglycosylase Tgt [Lentimicrobiaceae bacterium]|nr:tRNA guanosine(34) transglycosylase Tgt [Lentimicrobiaceae bacterium]